jgi:protein-disulfide isomerase
MADRAIGNPGAKLTVQEWFSLTCTHCARFAQEVFPEVKSKLIDTGRIRYVFKDFPLDQLALAAAMVARSLPPDRYEPFVLALLSSQDRWAFGRDVDPQAQLQQMAALAGMPKTLFDAATNDDALRKAILAEQDRGQSTLKIDSTPTFVFGTTAHAGEMTYDEFLKQVTAAGA